MQGQKKVPKESPKQAGYSSKKIVDAPEHYEYARAMGLLTWDTWNHEPCSFEERLKRFTMAYPVGNPARFQGSLLGRTRSSHFGPVPTETRLSRFQAEDNSFGSFSEILARYGLKCLNRPRYTPLPVVGRKLRELTIIRNQKLRQLHGSVDIEPLEMGEAKAAELDRLEKQKAAEEIRLARERMRKET
jgi:hypothetical protein